MRSSKRGREAFRLDAERVGDLIVANRPGYGWSEQLTADREVFAVPLKTGYKQAIPAEDVPGMWAPFMILGPGVRKGYDLGERPIDMVDQYPTILHLLGVEAPAFVQGRVLEEILAGRFVVEHRMRLDVAVERAGEVERVHPGLDP